MDAAAADPMTPKTLPENHELQGGSNDLVFDLVFDIGWEELLLALAQNWPRLDEEDLDAVERALPALQRGNPELLTARIRERYSMPHDEADLAVRAMLRRLAAPADEQLEHSRAT
jgi:hypothetical protein